MSHERRLSSVSTVGIGAIYQKSGFESVLIAGTPLFARIVERQLISERSDILGRLQRQINPMTDTRPLSETGRNQNSQTGGSSSTVRGTTTRQKTTRKNGLGRDSTTSFALTP